MLCDNTKPYIYYFFFPYDKKIEHPMKLQVFAASAHRKWNYTLWSLLHSCIIHLCCLCQQFHQQNLLIVPPRAQLHFKLHIPHRDTNPTTALDTDTIYKCPKNHLVILSFIGCHSFLGSKGRKRLQNLTVKTALSLQGLGREQGVSFLLGLRCSSDATELEPWLAEQ